MKTHLPRLVVTLMMTGFLTATGDETVADTAATPEQPRHLPELTVTARRQSGGLAAPPAGITIHPDTYPTPTPCQNVTDLLEHHATIDFRGHTDLVPDDDSIYLRGFDSSRFTTALNGIPIQKTGGRKSSHIVDYALLPLWNIETIQILPGPHSALYPGKTIGGVVNIEMKPPEPYESSRPDVEIVGSYKSYNTQNHHLTIDGGIGAFVYGFYQQRYQTDGYLRNNAADIDTSVLRLGYSLPADGTVSLSVSYTDADREVPVVNDPVLSDYDSGFPPLALKTFAPWQDPSWDKEAVSYRLRLEQPTPIGLIKATAFYGEENRDYSYWEYVDPRDPSRGIRDGSWETEWRQWGLTLQNEFTPVEGHTTTIGFDIYRMYDGYGRAANWVAPYDDKQRVDRRAGYIQDKWRITEALTLTAGLRYENTAITVSNWSQSSGAMYITGRDKWIDRDWQQVIPKSFMTYDLAHLSDVLRDTSLSVGVSRIWHAPDFHGDYNPQGRPAGAWIEPEHGIGYDVVLARRLWRDIEMRLGYSFYRINDYIAYNRTYSEFTPGPGNPVPPGLEYSDYVVNLDEVHRHGIDLSLDGELTDKLFAYLSYSYQEFYNRGGEPAGETELDDRAKHHLTAGLRYRALPRTELMLDYRFQSEQIAHTARDIGADNWVFEDIPIAAYHLVDVAIKQDIANNVWLKLFCENVFDEDYENSEGYPMTDRTFGVALNANF
ncbi:MAG: TonB-dependent receptor [Candidatus Pacebacteria bacterium]|nr:TonB-dependent receptor [Candidatus Paceibacterota bacterium]